MTKSFIIFMNLNSFKGLQETKHPYTFVAREGFREMLEVDDATLRTLPLLGKLVVPLRVALVS